MKKVNALVLGLVVLLALGCGGDDPEPDKTPEENFTSCRLKKTKQEQGSVETVFVYNNAGNLIQDNNSLGNKTIYEYNKLGKVSRFISISSGTDTIAISTYEYNLDSLATKITSYDHVNSRISGITTFEYDSQKRLVNKSYHYPHQPSTVRNKYLYTYIAKDRVLMESFLYSTITSSWVKDYDTEYTFDDKKWPYKNFSWTISLNGVLGHNELSTITTHYANGAVTYITNTSTQHTYNSAGYPTESIQNTGIGFVYKYKYEYDCQ